MRHARIYIALAALVFPMIVCQAVMAREGSEMERVPPAHGAIRDGLPAFPSAWRSANAMQGDMERMRLAHAGDGTPGRVFDGNPVPR